MPVGMMYSIQYHHKRKDVTILLKVGSMPPIEFVMGAEAFCQDLDFIKNDKGLAGIIDGIRKRKDLPTDYDFGSGGSDFDSRKWEGMMGDKQEGKE